MLRLPASEGSKASEFERAYGRMRTHGIGELVHARRLRRLRKEQLVKTKTPPPMTRDGQTLFPISGFSHPQ